MNRANQHALFQATNQGLLGIRQAEINYYVSLNTAFGTQAALVGGFTYGIFTQNAFDETQAFAKAFRDIYWIASSATIAAAVHVILSTMLLQTLGPGLALHGPVGSMVRACEGMREEQKMVTFAFAVMMVMFSLSTLMLFWTVMTIQAAAGSTFVWLVAVRFYYFYCERIYLRFYWKQEEDYLHRDDDKDPSEQYADGPKVLNSGTRENPMHARPQSMAMTGSNSPQQRYVSSEDGVAMTEKSSGRRVSMIPSMRLPFGRQSAAQAAPKPNDTEITDLSTLNSLSSKDILMQGYILMKRPSRNSKVRKTWKRYYFILNGLGHFFYYRNRQEYREKPEAPKRKRPLSLSEFHVTVWRGESMTENKTKGASSILFQFLLSPKDYEPSVQDMQETMQSMMDSDASGNNDDEDDEDSDETTTGTVVAGNRARTVSAPYARKWAMRCDTEEELNMWLDSMREVSPTSFSD